MKKKKATDLEVELELWADVTVRLYRVCDFILFVKQVNIYVGFSV